MFSDADGRAGGCGDSCRPGHVRRGVKAGEGSGAALIDSVI